VDEDTPSGFDTRQIQNATDFELPDYWDGGEILGGREKWPVCITLNLVWNCINFRPVRNLHNGDKGSTSALS
jgi:hypothetical protein